MSMSTVSELAGPVTQPAVGARTSSVALYVLQTRNYAQLESWIFASGLCSGMSLIVYIIFPRMQVELENIKH